MDNRPSKNSALIVLAGALMAYTLAMAMPSAAVVAKSFAYILAFIGVVIFEQASDREVAASMRLGALVAAWVMAGYVYTSRNPPPSVTYLIFVGCVGATIGYFDSTMRIQTKRIVYGAVALAIVWPSLYSLLAGAAFEKLFGFGAGKPMGMVAILAAGIYVAGLFVAPAVPDRPLPRVAQPDDEPETSPVD